ncbi:MAG: site-2 protease family protein [Thermoleophilia bacterium]
MRQLLEFLFLLPVLLLSMMAHEVAHGFIAYRLGDPTAKLHGRLTVNPLRHLDPLGSLMFVITYLSGSFVFGWAKPVPVNPYYFRSHQRGMMATSAAGPATNFLIAVGIAMLLNYVVPPSAIGTLLFDVMFLAYQVNVVLGVFNLVPIPPLDGSRVFGGLLPPHLYYRWAALDRYGILFILALFLLLPGPFFGLLRWAFVNLSEILLPAYF